MLAYCARYAFLPFCSYEDESAAADGQHKIITLNVVEFVKDELRDSEMEFSIDVFSHIFKMILDLQPAYEKYLESRTHDIEGRIAKIREEGYRRISESGMSMPEIEREEKKLEEQIKEMRDDVTREAATSFPCRVLTSHENRVIREVMLDLVLEKHHLSNIYLKDGNTELEQDKLNTLLLRAIDEWKNEILNFRIRDLIKDISAMESAGTPEEVQKLQIKLASLMEIRSKMAKCIGDRIIGV